ncbi:MULTISPECIES: MFS transporter [Prauserella salsuginis group]|uniref:MFS transporter n=1 Tax=Prauserella salsuginis TaxID=387889 RepID=A0ABW6G0X7_9PSEU|nr:MULTISPECIES: MFS transporter [Prauserella salsuginis group]MCR3722003.1 Sugar phosphate permease [Prauserella flava]MCR3736009.1 Sugar phosphate permease [Prauserella salsuginis]
MSDTTDVTPKVPLESATSKIMRRIVPLFAVMMLCNQLNRSNIGYAQHYLEADLGIGAAAYGLGAGLFFIAYTVFELPSNMLMERFGPKIWLSRICISWGVISAATMFVQGPTSFYVLRFLLGVAEAGFVPAVLYYLTKWLPNSFRGRANARYAVGALLAFSLSGPLSAPLLGLDGAMSLHGWQWLFLIEGLLSVAVGVFAIFWLDSKIADARWLSDDEKSALTSTIEAEEEAVAAAHTGGGKPRWYHVLWDRKVLLLVFIYFCVQMSIYANTFWLPAIVRGIGGLSDLEVGLLSSLPWVCAIASMFTLARIGDRTGKRRVLLVGALLTAAVGSFGAAVVSPWLALVFLCVAAMGFKSISPIFWPIVQRTLHPVTVGFAIAIINSIANLGGFVAPYGFGLVEQHTGSTELALMALAGVSLLAAAACAFVRDKPEVGPDASMPASADRDTPAVTPKG